MGDRFIEIEHQSGHESVRGQFRRCFEFAGVFGMFAVVGQRAVEFALKERYGKSGRIKLLLIANDGNFEGAIEGILGLSDILVVSGESVAMLTEAVSSDRPVIAFMPRKIRPRSASKLERSVGNLEKEALIRVSTPAEIAEDIIHYIGHEPAAVSGGDIAAVRAAKSPAERRR